MAEQLRSGPRRAGVIDRLRRPSRYAQIGLICAFLTNGLIIGLDRLGTHYLVATVAATVSVTLVGYLLHSFFTYRIAPSLVGLLRFCAATATGSCIALVSMIVLCDGFGLSASAAIPLATVFLFFWNYLLATWAIVRAPGATLRDR